MLYLMVYVAGWASAGALYCFLLGRQLHTQTTRAECDDWTGENYGAMRW